MCNTVAWSYVSVYYTSCSSRCPFISCRGRNTIFRRRGIRRRYGILRQTHTCTILLFHMAFSSSSPQPCTRICRVSHPGLVRTPVGGRGAHRGVHMFTPHRLGWGSSGLARSGTVRGAGLCAKLNGVHMVNHCGCPDSKLCKETHRRRYDSKQTPEPVYTSNRRITRAA